MELSVLSRRREVMLRLRQSGNFLPLSAGNNDSASESPTCIQSRWIPDRLTEMDRDALAEASTWLLSLGWLDRPMFESTWAALLAVCTPPQVPTMERSDLEGYPFGNNKEVRAISKVHLALNIAHSLSSDFRSK